MSESKRKLKVSLSKFHNNENGQKFLLASVLIVRFVSTILVITTSNLFIFFFFLLLFFVKACCVKTNRERTPPVRCETMSWEDDDDDDGEFGLGLVFGWSVSRNFSNDDVKTEVITFGCPRSLLGTWAASCSSVWGRSTSHCWRCQDFSAPSEQKGVLQTSHFLWTFCCSHRPAMPRHKFLGFSPPS